jgi:hypothetical protein
LQDRLRIILAAEPGPAGLTLTTECEPLTEGGTERIEWWLVRCTRCVLGRTLGFID